MTENNTNQELKTDDLDDDEAPHVEFDISVSPSDPTLEVIYKKIQDGKIIIPFYQRKYVWTIKQASRLIESFLMGLPVPQVFLYINSNNELEVIDGQQRIMSIKYFFSGYFGEDTKKGKVFKLTGLSKKSPYYEKTFENLDVRDQNKLENSTLRAINVKQIAPTDDSDCVFHIFERLNTGGTHLKPQEIRNAVYRGPIVDELEQLNQLPDWRRIVGISKPDKKQKDIELILRIFGLYNNWDLYQQPMITFLNKTMKKNKDFSSDKALDFKIRFKEAVSFIATHIDKPFRPKKLFNSSSAEAILLYLMEKEVTDIEKFKKQYNILIQDTDFLESIKLRATNQSVLMKRLTRTYEVLNG